MPPRKKILFAAFASTPLVTHLAILEKAGYAVVAASTFAETVSALESSTSDFDMVVLGASIPNLIRRTLAEQSKRLHPHIPIVMMFSHLGEHDGSASAIVSVWDGPQALLETMAEIFNKQQKI